MGRVRLACTNPVACGGSIRASAQLDPGGCTLVRLRVSAVDSPGLALGILGAGGWALTPGGFEPVPSAVL